MRTLAVLTLFVYLAPGCYAEDWDSVHDKGVDATKRREFAGAVDLFRRSLPLAQTETEKAVTENDLGIALCQSGHVAEAKIWLERALAAWSGDPARRTLYAQTAGALAVADRTLGNYHDAEAVLRAALEQQQVEGAMRSYLLSSLGDIMRELGDFDQARRLLKEADAARSLRWRERLDIEVAIAELDRDTRNWDASVKEWSLAVTLAREKGDAIAEAGCVRGLGQTWLDRGNASRAEPLLKTALAMYEREPTLVEGEIATALAALGELYLVQDKNGLAEEVLRRALLSKERSLGTAHPQTALVLELLADSVCKQGRTELARQYLDRAEGIMSAQFGERSMMAATVFVNRGALEQRAGNAEKSVGQYRKALDILGSGDWDLSGYRQVVMTRYAAALKSAHHKREAADVMAQVASFRSTK
jgi:tetratricopeptide (TPR) repeat protein